jgi:hypothetical protein
VALETLATQGERIADGIACTVVKNRKSWREWGFTRGRSPTAVPTKNTGEWLEKIILCP